jgi:dihydrodipicolinate synthase/N-acetylneuraminate lyase
MKKVYSASVTPLTENNRLDVKSLERIIDRNVRHGLNGIFILGSMGEWSQFDNGFRDQLVKESSAIMGERGEILAGIHSTGLDLTLKNMERVSKYKFDSFVLMLPAAYYSQINPIRYLISVLDASDRPVYYYHCPPGNGINFTPAQFEEFIQHPKLKGIKNSAGNMALRKELIMLKEKHKFLLLEGHEWAIDEALMVGCDGVLCGMGALASRVMVGIARAVDRKDYEAAVKLQCDLINIFHGVYGTDLSTIWVGQKYALKKLGIISTENTLIQSTETLTGARKAEIEACLDKYRKILD